MGLAAIVVSFALPVNAYLDSSESHKTEYIPINGIIGFEKSTIPFYALESNELPWGFVKGKIANHVDGYPVIIQFYQDGQAAYFAQVDVEDDGTYEHKFRVFDFSSGQRINLFDGEYTVVIFKMVYLSNANI